MENLTVRNLTFTYPLCDGAAIREVSFSIKEGEFLCVCGSTGSGKSTLLRLLKRELIPRGERSGEVLYRGVLQENLTPTVSACKIGYVTQKPEHQIVTDRVFHELAFGLENMHFPQEVMAQRIAETVSYFGMESWFEKPVSELSGGQKQLLNLASVMVMHPDVLILDEPTAQLDPIAASEFIATLKKLNEDFSLTILVTEHHLEELVPLCDRLLVLQDGQLIADGAPAQILAEKQLREDMLEAMPASVRLFRLLQRGTCCPLTVRAGRQFLIQNYDNHVRRLPSPPEKPAEEVSSALEFRHAFFRYEKNSPDILRDLCWKIHEKEIYCLLGGNGSGKTTLLSVAAGLRSVYRGEIRVFGKKIRNYENQTLYRQCLTLLPQDVQTMFLKNTVREELEDAGADKVDIPYDLSGLYEKHPYDCSGGEQQLIALARVLATRPRLLLMDEPTKGLDAGKKKQLVSVLKRLKQTGMTLVIVTHDVEFAASCADRCGLFFHGEIVSEETPEKFFSENIFYTTAAGRMSRGYYDGTVTVEQIAALCKENGRKGGDGSCS